MKYLLSDEQVARINRVFTYHGPMGDQPARYEAIRAQAREFAVTLAGECPPSRELSLALTKLEECVMHANSAIARGE